jgi:hypothetical protein
MTPHDLQPGATLYAHGDDGVIVPLKLASLFKIAGDRALYALAGRSDRRLKNCKRVAVRPTTASHDAIGTLALRNPLSSEDNSAGELFSVVEVDDKVARGLSLFEAQTSKPKTKDIFGKQAVRVRKIVEPPPHLVPAGQNRPPQRKYLRGFVAGQITQPRVLVSADDKKITLKRAIVAGSSSSPKRQRKFVEAGDAGTPVLSGSNRLLGFIVAHSGNETLVMPAEDLAKAYDLTFLSPERPLSAVRVKARHIQARA